MNIDLYANYHFELSLRDTPVILKVNEKRPEFEHLVYKD